MNLEARTVSAMIRIHCRAHHGAEKDLCADCAGLLAYAQERIAKCPFGGGKPVCNKCTVHCYNPEMRGRIQTAMRYAGPRMVWHHPILAIRHLIRSKKNFNH
ncbi:MAG: nitrous oxide-stimulated promoter family protein [Verrucomicrobia bacterium]|nr:MAG: nitrous oxide-stimulated promoter family protein [Verrucomicrobiota bacterium]